jgi:hypothetical protein
MNSKSYRSLSDEELSAQCRWEAFRARGPGGQHRDKTNTAVRVTHLPTEVTATGGEERSQRVNRIHALKRLRLKLALEIREPVDRAAFVPPAWFLALRKQPRGAPTSSAPTLKLTQRHRDYFRAVGLVIDVAKQMQGDLAATAAMLGISTSSLARFVKLDGQIMAAIRKIQQPQ